MKDGCDWLNDFLPMHPEVLEELKECQTRAILVKAAPAQVAQGEQLARNGDIDAAVDKLRQALEWNPELKFDPKAKAQAEHLVVEGKNSATEGKIKETIAAYKKAQQLDPKVEIDAYSWNSLCWNGSLRGYVKDVIFACNKAVSLAPDNAGIRDSRGVARALTGNNQGAIEDFEAFIASTDDKNERLQRQRWVNDLRVGKNPFTDEELKSLLKQ